MGDGSRRVEALHAQESAGNSREAAVVTNALLDYYSQNRAAGGMRVVDDDEALFANAEADAAEEQFPSLVDRPPPAPVIHNEGFANLARQRGEEDRRRREPGAPLPLPSRRTGGARRAKPRRATGGSPPRPLAEGSPRGRRPRNGGGATTKAARRACRRLDLGRREERQSDAAAAARKDDPQKRTVEASAAADAIDAAAARYDAWCGA